MPAPNASHTQKFNVVSHFDHLDVTNAVVLCMALWHHVTPVPMASHDKKSKAAHCFSLLDIVNVMVLLTVPLTSHVADSSSNSLSD